MFGLEEAQEALLARVGAPFSETRLRRVLPEDKERLRDLHEAGLPVR